jgi:DNA-binding transcriptional ArsR family regulator
LDNGSSSYDQNYLKDEGDMGKHRIKLQSNVTKSLSKAAADPIRVHAFSMVAEGAASSTEIADRLGLRDVSQVSYHLKVLRDLGLIELAGTKKRRGATELFYRSVQRPLVSEADWERFSPQERQNFTVLALQLVSMDIARSLASGTFDQRTDRHLTRTPLQLDQQGWRELVQIHLDAFYRSLEVQARSDQRRSRSGESATIFYSVQMLFEDGVGYRK